MEVDQGARIDSWGVGTRLAVAHDQPALGMVYKLSAVEKTGAQGYTTVIKASEQSAKATLPGILAARRYYDSQGSAVGDMIYDKLMPPSSDLIIDPFDSLRQKNLVGYTHKELLTPLVREGRAVDDIPSVGAAQANARTSLQTIPRHNRRLLNPHSYPVGLERQLLDNRDRVVWAVWC